MDEPGTTPRNPITHHTFDDDVIEGIAAALGATVERAPFQLPGSNIYQLTIENALGLPATMLTLWTGIHRVDAISPSSTVVFTDVRTVDLVGTVEVQFRRTNRELLIVARGGKVIVRA
ncbi:MAG: hypothetical protein KC438_01855 [Thermomicrobiales bacterium]|nr:hypothetical protein [Thermomicrobiales bacterium]MCO5221938.1 hypothetical protein [Thermomicrobiales bacterium]